MNRAGSATAIRPSTATVATASTASVLMRRRGRGRRATTKVCLLRVDADGASYITAARWAAGVVGLRGRPRAGETRRDTTHTNRVQAVAERAPKSNRRSQ